MKNYIRIAVILLAVTGFSLGAASRPNVIFILADDMGWGDLGVFFQNSRTSSQKFVTPNLDAFAREGIQLRRHYCPAPVCAPSRASLVLGVHQGHAGLRDNQFDKELENNHTLATVMKQAGYATACIGKWGLQGGTGFPGHPQNRGFDFFFGYISHGEAHRHYPKENGVKYYEGFTDISPNLDKCYSTDLATSRAKKWISDQHAADTGKPFFLYLTYTAPHARLQVPTGAYPAGGGLNGGLQWKGTPGEMINTANGMIDSFIYPDYAATDWPAYAKRHATMIRRMDDSVADLVTLLKDLGIDDNTLIVFTSDNGTHNESGSGGSYTYDPRFFDTYGPFEGIKRDVYEGGIRVPTLVRWPARIPAERISENPSQFHDWMPTFAEAAGLPKPSRSDGVSLIPTLTGNGTQKPSDIYVEYAYTGNTPNYSQFPNHRNQVRSQMQVVQIGKYKGVRTNLSNPSADFRIYDPVTDPGEGTNLSGRPGVPTQQQFKDRTLRMRRPGAGVTRPYDSEAVPAYSFSNPTTGLAYRYYEMESAWVPDWRDQAAVKEGTTPVPDLSLRQREANIGLSFQGYIKVPADGDYTFDLSTDTGAFVHLHDIQLIDADFGYAAGSEKSSGSIKLKAGYHPIRIDYRHANAPLHTFTLEWSGPGFTKQPVPADVWFSSASSEGGVSAGDDASSTIQSTKVSIAVLANDHGSDPADVLTISSVGSSSGGSAVINGDVIDYTPAEGFLGYDSFAYTVNNGRQTATGTVTMNVTFRDEDLWFPLNQTTGLTTWEAGGTSFANLLNFADPTAPWVDGREGRALAFDGTDDKVVVDGSNGISGAGSRTISAWINTSVSTTGDKPIVCWGTTTSGRKWILLMNSAGRLRLEAEGGYIVGTRLLNDGEWHHVACTFQNDGTPNVTDANLFVDGMPESLSASQGVTINTATTSAIQIGSDIQNRRWNGRLSDVRILSRSLSASEVADLKSQKALPARAWWKRHYGNKEVSWTDDSDGDGMNAILEYAFGRQPHRSGELPPAALAPDSDHAGFEFVRRPAVVAGINYEVQASSDLHHWGLPVTLRRSTPELIHEEPFERVVWAVENPGEFPTLFYRVKLGIP